jgi:hemolysin activation/secretion protein
MKIQRSFLTKILLSLSFTLFFTQISFAIETRSLPASVLPGVLSKTLSAQKISMPKSEGAVPTAPEAAQSGLGKEAQLIKFKLNKIMLEGNEVYTTAQLSRLYNKYLNTTISIAELEGIVQSITNYYRNNGYILSRAILPPQHVAEGIVHIRILEGYISNAHIQGDPKKAKCLLQGYANRIVKSKPLQIKDMEHYLRLANELPGTSVRAVLEPSKTETTASDLDVVAQQKTWGANLSYDNYGTRFIGPNEVTGGIVGNSVFQSGDSTRLTTIRTTRPLELKYVDFAHEFPLGTNGWRQTIGGNNAITQPEFTLQPLQIYGDATTFYTTMTYPIMRQRNQDLSIDGGFYYFDSTTTSLDVPLYTDHTRSVVFGFNYDSMDNYKGSNILGVHVEQGLNILGASGNPNSGQTSRFGADGIYTKFTANAGRLQGLFWRLSSFFYLSGQYSWNPLVASEQFAYGGSQLGRGYDPAAIIGDNGLGGTIELRLDTAPGASLLQTAQFYLFYDAGVTWDRRDVSGIETKQSATSAGIGVRFTLTKNLYGNLMIAQPLTKQVETEQVLGNGRKPRGFFSITASI